MLFLPSRVADVESPPSTPVHVQIYIPGTLYTNPPFPDILNTGLTPQPQSLSLPLFT